MKRSGALIVPRSLAIENLGVTYAHGGRWSTPVRELLGRHSAATEPMSDLTYFQREDSAVSHLKSLARADAKNKIDLLNRHLKSGLRPQRLWLARRWDWLRHREAGMLATQVIMDRSQTDAENILETGVHIEIVRLPDELRLPQILEVGSPIWIVDTRDFPKAPPRLLLDQISDISIQNVSHHQVFDALIRYRLLGAPGLYSYDHPDTEHTHLGSPPGAPSAFLTEEAAVMALSRFAAKIQTVLAIGGARSRQNLPGQDTLYLAEHSGPEDADHNAEDLYDFELMPALPPPEVIIALPAPGDLGDQAIEIQEPAQPVLQADLEAEQDISEEPKKKVRTFFSTLFKPRRAGDIDSQKDIEVAPLTEIEAFLASGVRLVRPASINQHSSAALKLLQNHFANV